MHFNRVSSAEEANPNAVVVVLFRCEHGVVRGWYLGPMAPLKEGGTIPYVPPSKKLLAMVAVVHARRVAAEKEIPVCVVDPERLWERMLSGD